MLTKVKRVGEWNISISKDRNQMIIDNGNDVTYIHNNMKDLSFKCFTVPLYVQISAQSWVRDNLK